MMTRLEAVNEMLDTIGEPPVSSLSTALPDAKTAVRILDRVSKRVLAAGWHLNTDTDYVMARDETGRIPVAPNILRIDTGGMDKTFNVSVRVLDDERFLYDKKEQSYTFPRALKCNVVWNVDFEDLTYGLQLYITSLSAREFQVSELGSIAVDGLIGRPLAETWATLQDEEAETEDSNILFDSPSVAWTTRRNNQIRYR